MSEQITEPSENIKNMGMAIFAYQLGHISFMDLIHRLDEMLGIPPLKFNHESKADPVDTKTT